MWAVSELLDRAKESIFILVSAPSLPSVRDVWERAELRSASRPGWLSGRFGSASSRFSPQSA